jgi:hypothetical protein
MEDMSETMVPQFKAIVESVDSKFGNSVDHWKGKERET